MNKYNKSVFEKHLLTSMTSGVPHKGATYQLPETIAMEFARLCYNTAIQDAQALLEDVGKRSEEEWIAKEFSDSLDTLIQEKDR